MKLPQYEKRYMFSERWLMAMRDWVFFEGNTLIYLGSIDGYLIFGEGLIDEIT